jgi:hypothetical protein
VIYLYIKTHNITGIKYLGKTTQDPYTYKGSGKRWMYHIKKHGNDVTTQIIGEFATHSELVKASIQLSEELNIVSDPCWANLRVEDGDGGDTSKFIDYSKLNRGKGLTYEQRYGAKKAVEMKQSRSRKFTEEHRRKISNSSIGKTYERLDCPHCNGKLPSNSFNRHVNLCKQKINKICPTCGITHRKKTEYCTKHCYYHRSNSKLQQHLENDAQ